MTSKLKAVRAGQRSAVTRLLKRLDEENEDAEEIEAILETLRDKQEILRDLDEKILTETAEEDIEREILDSGGNWPSTMALWVVDGLTWKSCIGATGSCDKAAPLEEQCTHHGGVCETNIDGYYIESILLIAVGFLWYIWRYRKVKQLDRLDVSAWKCS